MKSQYDVVIVGAGIGGVICGAYTAAGGLSTAVLEKAADVGGRITLDKTSPGFLGFENWVVFGQGWNGGSWCKAARELDADVRFYEVPEPCLYYRGGGKRYNIAPRCASPSALTAYYESLSPAPLSEPTRQAFIKAFAYVLSIPQEELWREPLSCIPFADYKDKISDDPQVIAFFTSIAANSTMCEADEAVQYLSAGGVLGILRLWWVSEGHCVAFKPDFVEGFVRPFSNAMQLSGGELFTSTEVTQVIIENDVAKGVVIKTPQGEIREIRAAKVVVNAAFNDIPRLLPTVPPEVQQPIDAYTRLPFHDFTLYAELDRPITAESHPFVVVDPQTGSNLLAVWAVSNAFPWNAPEGKQLIFSTRVLPVEQNERAKVRDTIKDLMDDIIEEVAPGFGKAVVKRNYCSHYPLWHYQHTWYKKIPYRSPSVKNLFFVGDCVEPQESMTTDAAASTGVFTGKAILRLEGR